MLSKIRALQRFEDGGACMAGNMQRQGTDACEWATVPDVGNGAEETQRQFANWYQSENPRWTKAARRYLEDFPYLVEDAVQEGWIKGDRQLLKSESAVTRLWSDAQSGDLKALDQLRGYMFRVVREPPTTSSRRKSATRTRSRTRSRGRSREDDRRQRNPHSRRLPKR